MSIVEHVAAGSRGDGVRRRCGETETRGRGDTVTRREKFRGRRTEGRKKSEVGGQRSEIRKHPPSLKLPPSLQLRRDKSARQAGRADGQIIADCEIRIANLKARTTEGREQREDVGGWRSAALEVGGKGKMLEVGGALRLRLEAKDR
jgi:hypothetical protein